MTVHIAGHAQRLRTSNPEELALWVEDVAPGLPIRPMAGNAWHHVAVWCPDLKAAVQALEKVGYRREISGGTEAAPAIFAYMTSDFGPRLELSDAATKPRLRAHLAGEVAPASPEPPSDPFRTIGVAAVVPNISVLETVQASWSTALGARWHAVEETWVQVRAPEGDRLLKMRSASTIGSVPATIIAPSPDCTSMLRASTEGSWDHVVLRSGDLRRDVNRFRQFGFTCAFHDIGEDGQPLSFAMMSAPEGTRIKLVNRAA